MSSRSVLAVALCAAMLVLSVSTAYADEPTRATVHTDTGERERSTAKTITIYSLVGVGALASGFAVVSYFQRKSAESEHDKFPELFGAPGTKDCLTSTQCEELRAVRRREELWGRLAVASVLTTVAAVNVAMILDIFWPDQPRTRTTRLAPSVTTTGGSLTFEGVF